MILAIAQIYVSAKHLRRQGQSCTTSCQCCTDYCRDGICRRYGEVADEKDKDGKSEISPCAYTECAVGRRCIIRQVQCFTFPCPGIAECVKNQTSCY
ncbi:hypothetical protein HCN44_002694 [Aphidius gifuensis]|uniref:Uncharacterized protein n=2 Tax=Aphidius gifuensis TaxID=684658 RepID=A0A834XT35_APHGI|nr:hypothetical protein HCN44_002694 [Aphidius gifuensis]